MQSGGQDKYFVIGFHLLIQFGRLQPPIADGAVYRDVDASYRVDDTGESGEIHTGIKVDVQPQVITDRPQQQAQAAALNLIFLTIKIGGVDFIHAEVWLIYI